jgi:hypothetical protein
MKDLQSYSILLISFFTICSGIYHITYWSTFDLNGLSYISISDLIKSYVYPFVASVAVALFNFLIINLFFNKTGLMPSGEGRNTNIGQKLNSKLSISILIIVCTAFTIYFYKTSKLYDWISFGLYLSSISVIILERINENKNLIKEHAKLIIHFVVILPVFSFVSGKYQSELIYFNKEYKYVAEKGKSSNIIYKLIGNNETQYFFSDLNNTKIYIWQADKIDKIVLNKYSKK